MWFPYIPNWPLQLVRFSPFSPPPQKKNSPISIGPNWFYSRPRIILYLLYRYWWNTRIFPFTKKSYLHRAQWRYYFYLSRVRILVSPWLLAWLANYKRDSAQARGRFFRNFISRNKINRTLHGRLGIRILSSSAESISHSWEILPVLEVKFVSPRGYVLPSIYFAHTEVSTVKCYRLFLWLDERWIFTVARFRSWSWNL